MAEGVLDGPDPEVGPDVSDGFYGDSEDLGRFYRVVTEDGKKSVHSFTCPPGTVFDLDRDQCVWPDQTNRS